MKKRYFHIFSYRPFLFFLLDALNIIFIQFCHESMRSKKIHVLVDIVKEIN